MGTSSVLAHSASFHPGAETAPSKPGIKHLGEKLGGEGGIHTAIGPKPLLNLKPYGYQTFGSHRLGQNWARAREHNGNKNPECEGQGRHLFRPPLRPARASADHREERAIGSCRHLSPRGPASQPGRYWTYPGPARRGSCSTCRDWVRGVPVDLETKSALSITTSGGNGGAAALVPTELRTTIIDKLIEVSPIRQLASSISMSTS